MDKNYYQAICDDFAQEARSEKYQNVGVLREWVLVLNEYNQYLLKYFFLRANKVIRAEAHSLMKINAKLVKMLVSLIEMPEEERARIKII